MLTSYVDSCILIVEVLRASTINNLRGNLMYIIKRNGDIEKFDKEKIYKAIIKAMVFGSGVVNVEVA